MNKKLLTLATAGTILLFANKSFGQEIANTLSETKKIAQTEITTKEIKNTLNNYMDYKSYELQKNKILKLISLHTTDSNYKKDFKNLINQYLIQNEDQILQNPESRKRKLEMLYFDCEFADIQTPEKLKYLLGLSNSRVMN